MTHQDSARFVRADDAEKKPERREFLLAVAGGIGCFASGGPALGKSLLVLAVPGPISFDQPTVTTTWSATQGYTHAGTYPATITYAGRVESPSAPGTYTLTIPPLGGFTGSLTETAPYPGGQTQPITIAWTNSFSYTPPATNFHTESWEGSYYTITSSRWPTYGSLSKTVTFTATYTTLAPKGGGMDGATASVQEAHPLALPADESDPCIETIDAADLDPRLPASRRTKASWICFAHGIAS